MGNYLPCFGESQLLLLESDGDEEAYRSRFDDEQGSGSVGTAVVLGEGEFGLVKLVRMRDDTTESAAAAAAAQQQQLQQPQQQQYRRQQRMAACKVLQKGAVFKDNVLYAPLKPQVLRAEVQILKLLAAGNDDDDDDDDSHHSNHYCLKLFAVYETPYSVLIVTEYCAGGALTEYIHVHNNNSSSNSNQKEPSAPFSAPHVSRIVRQLLSAVHHCGRHGILHRDIKPDNVMFVDRSPTAEIRLIDFGSGTVDDRNDDNSDDDDDMSSSSAVFVDHGMQVHTTFAGSAFYSSPEMFHRSYTALTDVWSVGVVLYVIAAGYPAEDDLQKAFNILQSSSSSSSSSKHKKNHPRRNLRAQLLPNVPGNFPDSFYDLLERCLTYRYKQRPTAETLLQHEFASLHFDEPIAIEDEKLLLHDVDDDQVLEPPLLEEEEEEEDQQQLLLTASAAFDTSTSYCEPAYGAGRDFV